MKIVWVKLKPKDIETKPIKGARDLHCILIDHVGLQGEFRQSKTHWKKSAVCRFHCDCFFFSENVTITEIKKFYIFIGSRLDKVILKTVHHDFLSNAWAFIFLYVNLHTSHWTDWLSTGWASEVFTFSMEYCLVSARNFHYKDLRRAVKMHVFIHRAR